jgi:hypothetical protein
VLAADYPVPTAYFDKDDLARLTYLENNPCSAAHGSPGSVLHGLDNEDPFFRNAFGTDVGIAGRAPTAVRVVLPSQSTKI